MPNFENENHLRMVQGLLNEDPPGRLRYGGVCSRLDLIEEHIQKHGLGITPQQYLAIANLALTASLSEPVPSDVNFVKYNEKTYRVV